MTFYEWLHHLLSPVQQGSDADGPGCQALSPGVPDPIGAEQAPGHTGRQRAQGARAGRGSELEL